VESVQIDLVGAVGVAAVLRGGRLAVGINHYKIFRTGRWCELEY